MVKGSRMVKGYRQGCHQPRVNSQWSVWYCILTLAFQIYIIANSIQRFTRYIGLPWPHRSQPYFELNAYVAFIGAAVVLLPFFVLSAIMKVGNHANDGYKLGAAEEAEMVVYQNLRAKKYFRWVKALWKHGGPIAPLLHMLAAMCLLLPRLLIQAQLIKNGFLSKDAIWMTDLDFVLPHSDRLVYLSFLDSLNETDLLLTRVKREELRIPPRTLVQIESEALISPEFINYALALLVYAVRYPAVFWKVNKCFGLLFSGLLIANAAQMLLALLGFGILYKVHIYGPKEVLTRFGSLLLSVRLSALLFLAYTAALALSGALVYMYGAQKYKEWQESKLKCQLITWKQEHRRCWGFLPHFGAFLVFLLVGLCASPLMYDYMMVYCGSLDGAMLAGVVGALAHLFLWIILWLALTIKSKWTFTGQHLTKEINLSGYKGGMEAPLLVIDNGQTYQVREQDSKKAILSLVQKSATAAQKPVSPTDDDDIYWLKPKPSVPKETKESPETDRLTWLKNQRKSPGNKHKVIFDDMGSCRRTRSLKKSPKIRCKKQNVKFEDLSDSDDGDYATLRDMATVREDGDGNEGEARQRPRPPAGADYEDLLESGQLRVPVSVHTPRSTDSGIIKCNGGDVSPRSLSEASTASPEKGSSESSSGVHSIGGDKRATSMEALPQVKPTWKSMSLQRTLAPPVEPKIVLMKDKNIRSFRPDGGRFSETGDSTVVIHRTQKKAKKVAASGDPFGRATNIRMTSFTDQPDFPVVHAASPRISPIGTPSAGIQDPYTEAVNHLTVGHYNGVLHHQRRDSANYSLASSAESENCATHS